MFEREREKLPDAFVSRPERPLGIPENELIFPGENESLPYYIFVAYPQYDQIGRFIVLWTTFQSLWQQLVCPNRPHSNAIFVKVSKSLIFLVKSVLGNF